MNIAKWVRLFFRTLGIGIAVYFIIGAIAEWNGISRYFSTGDIKGVLFTFANFIIFGGMFSVISQMGFFAYLTVHRIGLGIFRSYWSMVQVVLIAFAFFDLIYFRYTAFGGAFWTYFIIPVVLLFVSLAVSEVKKRETNRHAYIPTFFLMFVVTTIEWLVGLTQSDSAIIWEIGLTLMACNAYQVLTLHRLIAQK